MLIFNHGDRGNENAKLNNNSIKFNIMLNLSTDIMLGIQFMYDYDAISLSGSML